MSAGPRTLDVVQRWFQAVVTHRGGVADGAESQEAQALIRLNRGELEAVVCRSRNLTAAERLSIYANAYYARLLECLGEAFPILRKTLGEEVFTDFAFEYLQSYPSRSYTLDHLGESFPRFLAETRPEDEPGEVSWPDFLIDLATLEQMIAKVFDGRGVEGRALLTPEALQALPADRFAEARLQPVVCLRLLAFRYPVSDYYTAARRSGEGEEIPIPDPKPEWVALIRRDFIVRRYPLSLPQFVLLAALQNGATMAAAIAAAAEVSDLDDDTLAAELRSWFELWAAEGFFNRVL